MERIIPCPLSMLMDVTIAVERHQVDAGQDGPIAVGVIADMVNRVWRGCGPKVFTDISVQKALLELQAMDTLQCDWIDQNSLHARAQPKRPSYENIGETFHGMMGTYDNPTPFSILRSVFKALPDVHRLPADAPSRVVYPSIIAKEEYLQSSAVVMKVFRELRYMWAINYTYDGVAVIITDKSSGWCSSVRHEKAFGT